MGHISLGAATCMGRVTLGIVIFIRRLYDVNKGVPCD
jgi:hypothetical protein